MNEGTQSHAHHYTLSDSRVIDIGRPNIPYPTITLNGKGIKLGCAFVDISVAKHLIQQWEKSFGRIEETITLQ